MTSRTVFVDTWAWIALTVGDDPDHQRVAELDAGLGSLRVRKLTSNFVLAEALTRLRYDASHRLALALVDVVDEMVMSGALEVVTIDQGIWASAVRWFRRFDDQRFSFVDCTSFAIMEARGLTEALTADRHFATAGFMPLGA